MFIRLLKYSVKNILRNKFLSISSILILTLLIFFINLLLLLHNTSFELINYVNNKMSISLYLKDNFDKNSTEVIDFINNIKKETGKQTIIKYKSKETILEEIRKQDIEFVKILEKDNPLPNTITISNIPLNDYKKVNEIIKANIDLFSNSGNDIDQNKDEVFANYKSQYDRIQSVIKVLKTLGIGLYIIIGIFIFAIAIITYSIIGNFIYYYREEIYITKLVGGSKIFIYGPFALQGVLYSIIAFLISSIIFYFFVEYGLVSIFGEKFSLNFLFNNISLTFFLELLLFVCIGMLSGYFSSKKYIK